MSTYEERQLGSSSASILYADGRIYVIAEQGKAAVVKPGKTFQLLATNDLQERTLASMSVCDNDLLIRTEKALYRIGKGDRATTAPAYKRQIISLGRR